MIEIRTFNSAVIHCPLIINWTVSLLNVLNVLKPPQNPINKKGLTQEGWFNLFWNKYAIKAKIKQAIVFEMNVAIGKVEVVKFSIVFETP